MRAGRVLAPGQPATGITLNAASTGNAVTNNDSSHNHGFGISAGPGTSGNAFVNKTARANALVDLQGFPGTTNPWNDNNRCGTEGGAVPPEVCNPSEERARRRADLAAPPFGGLRAVRRRFRGARLRRRASALPERRLAIASRGGCRTKPFRNRRCTLAEVGARG